MADEQNGHVPRESLTNAPPRLPFVLAVGVTGHRMDAFPSGSLGKLEARLRSVLTDIVTSARQTQARTRNAFGKDAMRLIFVSPLADGSDQAAAAMALELGFELHAVLPFARSRYRETLPDAAACATFDRLLSECTCILELPGAVSSAFDAYVMTGRATIAHSDLLIAVWDGLAPRGRGGTGEVVHLAMLEGIPVVHVPVQGDVQPRLMWSAFDPAVITQDLDEMTARPFSPIQIDQVMAGLFAPPADPQEREFLGAFHDERSRRFRTRIEYPLLLTLTGVKRIRPSEMREDRLMTAIREEWQNYRDDCARRHDIDPALDVLEDAFSWADRLATYYAQTYRSGHVFNFVLGAVAICVGLTANIFNQDLLDFAIAEGILTAGIILNTRLGVKNDWHRRWLDYRQLAERLRPMRSLKLLGIAAPDPPGSAADPVPKRWIDWYAAGVWRAMGCPSGCLLAERVGSLARAIAEHEIAPQVAYHRRHAQQIELLDSRLEVIAAILFWITLLGSVAVVIGLVTIPELIGHYGNWFTLIGAGFPALGTAVFGIRFQADFGGSAVRSLATGNALARIGDELGRDVSLPRAANLTEQAARTMLADLEEWRLVNQQQELDLL